MGDNRILANKPSFNKPSFGRADLDINMISAKEAREKTDSLREERDNKEMFDIMGKILKAINLGEGSLRLTCMRIDNKDKLEELGYIVTPNQCGPMESELIITW